MSTGWKYLLHLSDDMSLIGEFKRARGRTLTVDNNKSGAGGCTLRLDQPLIEHIVPWETCLVAQRDDDWIWSGPISTINYDLALGHATIAAIGWSDLLNPILIQADISYSAQDAGAIAEALLALANAQHPTGITIGTIEVTQPRNRSYVRDNSIGQEIQALGELESGYDWYIDPRTKKFNIVARRGVVRPEIRWIYIHEQETGKGNCKNIQIVEDGNTIVNDSKPRGTAGQSGFAQDLESQERYGLRQEVPSLSDVPNQEILNAYAEAEIVYKKDPRTTYQIFPKASHVKGVPKFGKDFDIGDTGFITARRGFKRVDNQAARMFGVDISIAEDGSDTITRLQTSAN